MFNNKRLYPKNFKKFKAQLLYKSNKENNSKTQLMDFIAINVVGLFLYTNVIQWVQLNYYSSILSISILSMLGSIKIIM